MVDDGANDVSHLLALVINASILALMDAGLPMSKHVVATIQGTAVVVTAFQTQIQWTNLENVEHEASHSDLLMWIDSHSDSDLDEQRWEQAQSESIRYWQRIRNFIGQ
jgi:hypothetical protein